MNVGDIAICVNISPMHSTVSAHPRLTLNKCYEVLAPTADDIDPYGGPECIVVINDAGERESCFSERFRECRPEDNIGVPLKEQYRNELNKLFSTLDYDSLHEVTRMVEYHQQFKIVQLDEVGVERSIEV